MFKLDFEKGFNLVKWNFLDYVMAKLNFSIKQEEVDLWMCRFIHIINVG